VFLYFPAIFQSVIFALILELLAFYKGFFWFFLIVFLFFCIISFRLITKSWMGWYIALIFFLSVWTILQLIDYNTEKQIFAVIGILVNYFLFFGIYRLNSKPDSRTARAVISMSLMAVAFLFFSATYGIYLNFDVSSWELMVFYFLSMTLLSYQYFLFMGELNKKTAFIYSLILGFVTLEMAWVVNFWPFGYLTTGVVLLMFYYIIWDIAQNHFLNTASIKKVIINLFFFLVASGTVLYSSVWLPNI
jgi:hypothetical protein